MGVDVGSIGDAHGKTPDALSFVYQNSKTGVYKKLVTDSDGNRLLGAVLVGDTEDYSNLLQLFLNDMDLPDQPESLILPNVEKPAMGWTICPTRRPFVLVITSAKATFAGQWATGHTALTT